MVGVAVAGTDTDAAACEGFHRAEADVRLLAPWQSQMLWHDADKRTGGATVGFLRRQGDLYDVPFWHCFSVFV